MSTIPAFTAAQDERIEQNVNDQLASSPEIDPKDISVKVRNRCVTLTGSVHSYLEKAAAERIAKSVVGVEAVADDIEVFPSPGRSDSEIARDVAQALQLHSSLREHPLKASVHDGFVTLEGEVAWDFQKRSAEWAAKAVAGVRGLLSSVTFVPHVAAKEVKNKIEAALQRTAVLDARSMSVIADGSTVSLYGIVHSWHEKDTAERIAKDTPGVRWVANHLHVAS